MKKILFLLLILAALSTIAFAAEPYWGIWGRTVLNLLHSTNAEDSELMSSWGPNWWTNGYGNGGFEMGFNLSFSDDVFGYNMGFQWENWDIFGEEMGDDVNFAGAKFFDLNGTVKVVPDMLDLKIGLLSDGTYKYDAPASGDWDGKKIGDIWAVTGLLLTFAPKDSGISATVNYRVPLKPDREDNPGNNAGNGDTVENCIKATDVCASYSIPDTVTITAGTLGSNPAFGDEGKPIFGGVKFDMLPNLNLIAGLQYVIANEPVDPELDPPTYDSIYSIMGITYTLDAFTAKLGGLLFYHMTDPDAIMNYRAATEVGYTMGNIWIALFGNYTHKFNQWLPEPGYEDFIEINPVVKYNPIGVQIGFWCMYNVTADFLEWTIPLQIDFSFW